MTPPTVIERLRVLPGAMATAELELHAAENARLQAVRFLQQEEDALLLDGTIDGKNSEVRAAQIRQLTASVREVVEEREHVVARLKIGLRHLQAEHSSLRAIARLLAGGELAL
jgi:hypothetical protein